jgi:hypothetical protein
MRNGIAEPLQGLQGMSGLNPAITRESSGGSKTQQGGTNPQNPANPAGIPTDALARLRTALERVDPVLLAVALVQVAEKRQHDDALLVALALAVEAAHLRMPSPLDDYLDGRFHRNGVLLPEYTDLQRRRYPPTGRRDIWIKYGPSGPPAQIGGMA